MLKTISVRQAMALYNAVEKMKESGVSVKALKNIDLAINKQSVLPIVLGYEKARELVPEGYKKYIEKIENLKLSNSNSEGRFVSPPVVAAKIEALKVEHSKDIAAYEEWKKDFEQMVDATKEVDIIELSKDDFKFDENNLGASDVVFGLLPCIKM